MARQSRKVPEIYHIPASEPFLERLADGLLRRFPAPESLARLRVLLPTRRAARALAEILVSRAPNRATLLPRIDVMGDIDELELTEASELEEPGVGAGLKPQIPEAERLFLLTRQIHAWYASMRRHRIGWPEAMAMARQLAGFIDAVEIEEVNFADLRELAPAEYAAHWGEVLSFLAIVTDHWPRILAERDMMDASRRRSRLIRATATAWRQQPPAHPIVAAGSTGSVKATADLLSVVARLPEGAVVLPGLDPDLDAESWDSLGPEHPQYQLRELLGTLRIDRSDVLRWPVGPEGDEPQSPREARLRFVNEALRPAATLAGWRRLKFDARAISAGLSRIDCPGLQQEAATIALVMRETLETPTRTAALVTRNRELARRVAGELGRWGIEIEDSAGRPLMQTPPAVFLSLLAEAANSRFAPAALLSLLKHPLAARGEGRGRFLRQVRRLEIDVLRGRRIRPGLDSHLRTAKKSGDDGTVAFVDEVKRRLEPFAGIMRGRKAALSELLDSHIAAAVALNRWEEDETTLFDGPAGEMLASLRQQILAAGHDLPPLPPGEYPMMFKGLLEGRVVRPRRSAHPRLHIWGTLEARLQSADRIILGGMNEGSWPPEDPPDPWLSRPMRRRFGLTGSDRRQGQSAHDFVGLLGAKEVIITRSEKIDGTPTIPSRWLSRLEALGILLPGGASPWLAWQESLDGVSDIRPAMPPAPQPPRSARPREYWVSDIDLLIRDPYAFYARRILKLRPLDPVDPEPDAAERGILIHRILERFIARHPGDLPADALDELLHLGRRELKAVLGRPRLAAFWWPRFERAARAFLDSQRKVLEERKPVGWEIAGGMELDGPGGPVTIRAKADRVDRRTSDSSLVILDYKTGSPPSKKQVEAGLAPQMPLEGAIAAAGGFPDIPTAPVGRYEYWQVSGKPGPTNIIEISDPDGTLRKRISDGVAGLVARFLEADTPYLAKPRPWISSFDDYDHLSRLREWQRAGKAAKGWPQ